MAALFDKEQQEPRKMEQDLRKMEQSLFADVANEDSVGLLPKAKKEEGPAYAEEKQIVLKFNPARAKQRLKKGLFWLVLVVLVVSFFYNPFYKYFPWNRDTGLTGAVVAEPETLEEEAAAAEPENAAAEAPVVEEEPSAEQLPAEAPEETETAQDEAQENETAQADDAANATANATSSSGSGTLTFTITDIELIKTTYGWKVGKVSFEIKNDKEAFVGKIRARGFNSPNRMDMRSDKDMILGPLNIGSTIDSTIELNAQFDKAGEKLVVVELFDEGDETGTANDRRMASAEKKVTAQ